MELSPGIRVSSSPPLGGTEDHGLLWHLPPSDALLARPEMVSGGPGSPGYERSSRQAFLLSSIFLSFGGLSEA